VYLALPVLGMLVATRQRQQPLAWVFIATGSTMALWVFADGYAVYSLLTSHGSLPGGGLAAWLANWIWIPGWALGGLLLLLFPYGRFPSKRWRPLGWVLVAGGLIFSAASMLVEGGLANYTYVDNPVGLVAADAAVVKLVGTLAMLGLGLEVIASLVPRARRATGDERQQYKWVSYAATVVVGTMAVGWTLFGLGIRNMWVENATLAVAGLLPIAAAIAVLKFRLYDIDVVINKTLVYGALASFVTAVYVAVVVGLGAAFGSTGERDLPLSIAATALVAVAFQPARQRVQTAVNRLVYGKRASPYEVLANFSQRMGELLGNREVLDQTAQLLGEATGAARAEVWLRSGEVVRAVACWPDGSCSTEALALDQAEDWLAERASLSVPVRQRGELLGALTVETRAGESVRPVDVRLASDLAAQAAHVLGNVRLTRSWFVAWRTSGPLASAWCRRRMKNVVASSATSTTGLSSTWWHWDPSRAGGGGDRRGARAGPDAAGGVPTGGRRGPAKPARPGPRDLPAAASRRGPRRRRAGVVAAVAPGGAGVR